MRRLFWVAVGAGAGAYATHKVTRVARRLTPRSLAGRAAGGAAGAGDRLRLFAEDVRFGMREREAQLREAIELDRELDRDREPPRRVLRARYTVIDDDKDGH